MNSTNYQHLKHLQKSLDGELFFDDLTRVIYATDASIYRKLPLAVAYPKNEADVKQLIAFAKKRNTSLIPRAAGTSLAGQCVGDGIVVDVSKHFTKIIGFNKINQTVTVQPGVVRDQLNNYLKPFGLFFGPNTSTSNRCTIAGMVGNNSSGTTSIQYGATRDKVVALRTLLSDGSIATFNEITKDAFLEKTKENTLEASVYKTIYKQLESKETQQRIKAEFPNPEIHRRNTGYAIDALINSAVFSSSHAATSFNLCNLLTGSEGTLAFTTEITLKLDKLPPKENRMLAVHFNSVTNCLQSVAIVMQHNLHTCEMMDKTILDLTKHNKTQEENRQFIQGDPEAILFCELRENTLEKVNLQTQKLVDNLEQLNLSYAISILKDTEIEKAQELRKAGLGLLSNIIGDKKTVACIEDTAVALPDLANYIADFSLLMQNYQQQAVYYAHAGAGELHLRPILNLKQKEDVILFKKITTDVAKLVKKYKGSMSGEHGDGIVRSSYISYMIGEANYAILQQIKNTFDPDNIFNPGKIVAALPIDENLRYQAGRVEPQIHTFLDFSKSQGILRETEKCNGSGDCRKLSEFGGTMCPSFRATRNEKDTTRARANALREFLTNSEKANKFNHKELKTVFDLCLSCKACVSECPSSVDVASLKAEFQYQYQQANGVSLRTKLFAHHSSINQLGSRFPKFVNFLFSNKISANLFKKSFGIASQRNLPLISNTTLYKQFALLEKKRVNKNYIKSVYLFVDAFTNFLDSQIGVDALELLWKLNYRVFVVKSAESGRAFLSKGLLAQAQKIANKNVAIYKDLIAANSPLIGIEPSAILTFKDEYLKLATDKVSAKKIAKHTFLIEEFLQQEINLGNITASQFTKEARTIMFHGHCYQKALSNQLSSFQILNLPEHYKVSIIPSGCCGMAGSFGYEKEHYLVSMQIGEQTLFPAIRKAANHVIIAANGTSCRHQIKDGTQRQAMHPVSILKNALI